MSVLGERPREGLAEEGNVSHVSGLLEHLRQTPVVVKEVDVPPVSVGRREGGGGGEGEDKGDLE